MKRNYAPSIADILFIVVAPLTAITRTIKLTHSDGDLAAHIRMGQVILDTGAIPRQSLVSITAASDPLIAHGWLSEVIFAALFSTGGLALISVIAGLVIASTHAGVALYLRSKGVDARWALAAALMSLAVSSTHWLARPHMFSILGASLTLYLLDSQPKRRLILFAALFALWANLHGGWLFGVIMIAAWVLGDLVEAAASTVNRENWLLRARTDGIALVAALLGTLTNPFGIALHREVVSGATSADLARQMGEFMPPNFQSAAALPFFLALLLTVALLAMVKGRMSAPHLMILVLSTFFALRSFRNMALFGVTAWPLVALHAAKAWPAHRRGFPFFGEIAKLDKTTFVGLHAGPVAALLLILGFNRGMVGETRLVQDSFSSQKFPVAAVERARTANLDGAIFEAWRWGGYIMYAWPSARLIVDPLKFNAATVNAYSVIDAVQPGWQDEMRRWNIRTVIVDPDSPLARTLGREPGWRTWYADSTSTVFRRETD